MATIDSVQLYLDRTSNRTGWNIHVDIREVADYSDRANIGDILGSATPVLVDTVPTHGSPDWVTFTFSPAVSINDTGFYGIHIWCDTSSYQATGLYWYGASDWSSATTGKPYTGKEYAKRYDGSNWVGGGDRAYILSVSGVDGNEASTPRADPNYYTFTASVDYGDGVRSYVAAGSLSKPTDPTPPDSLTPGYDFSDWTLSWEDGGGAESYKLYIGTSEATLNLVTSPETETYTIPVGSIYRNYSYYRPCYWRVDAIAGEDTATGDVWNFDPRPAKVTTPDPADEATGEPLNVTLSWAASDIADDYDVYLTPDLAAVSVGQEGVEFSPSPRSYSTEYTWRVDASNEFGTTTGDEWTFATIQLDPPSPTYWSPDNSFYYRLIPGGSTPEDGGVENVDYEILDGYLPNFIYTNKKMVAFAKCGLYYED